MLLFMPNARRTCPLGIIEPNRTKCSWISPLTIHMNRSRALYTSVSCRNLETCVNSLSRTRFRKCPVKFMALALGLAQCTFLYPVQRSPNTMTPVIGPSIQYPQVAKVTCAYMYWSPLIFFFEQDSRIMTPVGVFVFAEHAKLGAETCTVLAPVSCCKIYWARFQTCSIIRLRTNFL